MKATRKKEINMTEEWKVIAPHYDEVKALEMIRKGVDSAIAYKQCLVETVGPVVAEVPFRR